MQNNINIKTTNIIKNFEQDREYFFTPNQFRLKSIKIGPFSTEKKLNVNINDFMNQQLKFGFSHKVEKVKDEFYSLIVSNLLTY